MFSIRPGLPVEGATVRLLNKSTDAEHSVSSGPDGQYHFFALQPGTYAIMVTKSGFAALRRDGVALRAGDQLSVDLTLQIGNVEQSVNLTAAAPLLQATRLSVLIRKQSAASSTSAGVETLISIVSPHPDPGRATLFLDLRPRND